ncbi:pilus assembly protein [Bifidobacterium sp. DSM 109958]|uniref:Pilus assembly protein n=1 Tax=Bifidobacterium moraviense TaxID=2675323 RepID=A0A7Y0F242_9BIFI|nr:ATPase, T2SS/T4P/T4SS family [Bifidobacterium sp. DSM 109958]NMN00573.1 pilus assembly protein [Bifidobacterium sp. DSM 109958]
MERRDPTVRFGPLEALASDPSVTDVAVTCDGTVWVDRGSGMREARTGLPLRGERSLRDYAVQLCSQLGRRLDDASPIADASTPDGIRVHAVIAPLVPRGAALSIRFPDRVGASLERLRMERMMPPLWERAMRCLVLGRASMLITGGTGTGKTTLLKALLAACPAADRIVTVEEVRELGGLNHRNHVSLVTREANVEGAGAVGLPQLVKVTLRMRPDRVVLGECRGEEIADLLRAFNSGHHGGMATLHADGVERVPSRLAALGLLAGLSPEALAMFAEGAFDAVLHLDRVGGRRLVTQIGRLAVGQDGRLVGRTLGMWDGAHLRVTPQWRAFAVRWGIEPGEPGMGRRP